MPVTAPPAPPRRVPPRRVPMDDRIRARRASVRAEQARRRRRVTLSVVTLVLLAVAATAVARSPLFAVTTVQVTGVEGAQAEQVRAVAGVRPGQNLLGVDLAAVEAEVTGLPWVRQAQAARVPPATVEIRVAPRQVVAVVDLADASWLVDETGVVIAGGRRDDVVRITAPNSVLPGPGVQASDAAVRNALAVHAALPAGLRAQVDRYDAPSERGLRLYLREGVWVRVGLAERVELKAEVILALLEQARAQGEAPGEGIAELDVRAPENPVLVPAS